MEVSTATALSDECNGDLLRRSESAVRDLRVGERCFLVAAAWWTMFREYAEERSADLPTAIENNALVDPTANHTLRPMLMPNEHYCLVSSSVWSLLVKRYGADHEIERFAIENPQRPGEVIVEVYPLRLKCFCRRNGDLKALPDFHISKSARIRDILAKAQARYDIGQDYIYFSILDQIDRKAELWTSLQTDQPIGCTSVNDGDVILFSDSIITSMDSLSLDERDGSSLISGPKSDLKSNQSPTQSQPEKTPFWSRLWKNRSPSNASQNGATTMNANGGTSITLSTTQGKRGRCGLANLGNTCFMNSGIQCLAHTVLLREYFLTKSYSKEINSKNVLGTGGELVKEFAKLMQALWDFVDRSIAPRSFKQTLGKFAPQFSGYLQHDSQELLIYLLDGLHEDLNRVSKKPYMQIEDDVHKPLDTVADETWSYHKKRNDSAIVDIFHGQLKLRIHCDTCGSTCYACDPLVCLPLSIPTHQRRSVDVVMIFESSPTTKYRFMLDVGATVCDLKDAILAQTKVPTQSQMIVLATLYHFALLKGNESLYEYTRSMNCLYCFEIQPSSEDEPRALVTIQPLSPQRASYGGNITLGISSLHSVKRDHTTYRDLARRVCAIYKAHMTLAGYNHAPGDDVDPSTLPFRLCRPVGGVTQGDNFEDLPHEGAITDLPNKILCVWNTTVYEASHRQEMDFRPIEDASVTTTGPVVASVNLYDCLQEFSKEFRLSRNNAWKCPVCAEPRLALKKYGIIKFPKILIIQLKRFHYTSHHRDKIDACVDFPLEGLTLEKCFWEEDADLQSPVYDLYAVSNHMGGLGGGHYTAFCKNSVDGNWYCFDDRTVTQIEPRKVISSSAYILFYAQRESTASNPSTSAISSQQASTNTPAKSPIRNFFR
eukprot:TRINITY_DN4856_c0_g2_i1.p1 TRINITY_DN4856_c0_g2~~TRINITY_DN4856_c0_g2_i1.p1  ORF type:complete len:886 (+),score=164.79 TRINITY_DN4856_c0_g2_i1:49-2706(+)